MYWLLEYVPLKYAWKFLPAFKNLFKIIYLLKIKLSETECFSATIIQVFKNSLALEQSLTVPEN